MTALRPPAQLDRAFFALVTRGWNALVMLPLLYFWTEKAA